MVTRFSRWLLKLYCIHVRCDFMFRVVVILVIYRDDKSTWLSGE